MSLPRRATSKAVWIPLYHDMGIVPKGHVRCTALRVLLYCGTESCARGETALEETPFHFSFDKVVGGGCSLYL